MQGVYGQLLEEERPPATVIVIQTMFVECTLATAREWFQDNLGAGRQYAMSRDMLHKMRELEAAKKVTVTACPQISTISGSQAQVRTTTEFSYVIDYDIGEMGETPITRTREVGTILNVTPLIDADGETIHLTVIPEYCRVIKPNRRVEYVLPLSRIATHIECPEFTSYNMTTSVTMKHGATVMVGGGNPSDYESKDAQATTGFWLITTTLTKAK